MPSRSDHRPRVIAVASLADRSPEPRPLPNAVRVTARGSPGCPVCCGRGRHCELGGVSRPLVSVQSKACYMLRRRQVIRAREQVHGWRESWADAHGVMGVEWDHMGGVVVGKGMRNAAGRWLTRQSKAAGSARPLASSCGRARDATYVCNIYDYYT